MIKTYCDKCGKELNYEETISPIEIKYEHLFATKTRHIDICSKCNKKFVEYINKYLDGSSDEGN